MSALNVAKIEPKALEVLEIIREHLGDDIALGGGAVIDSILGSNVREYPAPKDYDVQVFSLKGQLPARYVQRYMNPAYDSPPDHGRMFDELVMELKADPRLVRMGVETVRERSSAAGFSFRGAKFSVGSIKFDLVHMPNGEDDLLSFHLNTDLVTWRWFDADPRPKLHRSIHQSVSTGPFVLNHVVLSKSKESPLAVARARIIKARTRMTHLRTLDNFVAGQLLGRENAVLSWFTHPKLDADMRMAAWLDGQD